MEQPAAGHSGHSAWPIIIVRTQQSVCRQADAVTVTRRQTRIAICVYACAHVRTYACTHARTLVRMYVGTYVRTFAYMACMWVDGWMDQLNVYDKCIIFRDF